jgi:hypothetical protein
MQLFGKYCPLGLPSKIQCGNGILANEMTNSSTPMDVDGLGNPG